MNKQHFLNASTGVSKIEDALKQAQEIYDDLPDEIKDAIAMYHNDTATLGYCLRWGTQAAEEIRQDWHMVVSKIPCDDEQGGTVTTPESIRGKEKFTNAGGECYVMERGKRVPTTALIFRPCNTLTPYIVAVGHEPGQSSWQSGKYYGKLSDALKEMESWDATGDVQDAKQCPFCGGNAILAREYHTPTQTIYIRTDGAGTPEDRVLTECPKYVPLGMVEAVKLQPRVNDGWLIECEKCGARGPHEYTDPIQCRDKAVELWNERSGDGGASE